MNIKQIWANLSERDKLVSSVGGIILLVYLFYIAIYSPLTNAVDVKSKQWIEKTETLNWMRQQDKVKRVSQTHEGNLLTIFSNELKRSSFSQFQYQLQQAGDTHIQLSFNEVPFVELLAWLRKLNEEYSMEITELSATPVKTAGLVKLHLVVANQEKKTKS